MENKITCPMCNAEKMCLEETQADFSSYMCFRCGYMSDSRFTDDSEYLKTHLKNTPQVVIELKSYDLERLIYWYPSVVNVPDKGVVFPKEYPESFKDTYCWVAAKYVESEREGYDFELDMENSKEVESFLFYEALKYIGVVVEGGVDGESNHAMA